ncbi:hypothetical protein DPMN_170934 [Dreissena polymorpha]|uniref:Uncharacterized protein n=1 Tax=Dreissena polymorpha TaxID=45954 RepID=A0A9D4DZI7_DREPO|nr:hypothetical protein DPMN_170934 [Dreissena polymorpha]
MITESTGSLHRALVWATSNTICAADIRGIHDEVEYINTNKTCFSNAGTNIHWLTVDSHVRTVIFADGSDIYAMTLDGVHTKQRVTSATENVTDGTKLTSVGVGVANFILPLKLHSYKNHLLVADTGNKLDVLSITNSGSTTYNLTTRVAVTDIGVVDITEQQEETEHICIPLGRNRICQCSYGYILDSNKDTCSSGAYRAHPDRLALDYSTGNIYYTAVTSSQLPTGFTGIGVVSPNGFHRKLILEGVHPRAIEIDPSKGFLFWTDFGTTPAVLKRAETDGTNIVTLYSAMIWPNGIAIDTSASALYVTDGKKNIIYRRGYEANTCVQYFSDPESQLMDIKLLGNYLYYTAWNKVPVTMQR